MKAQDTARLHLFTEDPANDRAGNSPSRVRQRIRRVVSAVQVLRREIGSDGFPVLYGFKQRTAWCAAGNLPPRCMLLEKKLGREIAAAKEVERLTSPHVDPAELPQRPKWEYGGDEESLIAAREQEDAATGS